MHKIISIDIIKPNPNNPRKVDKTKFKQLVKSIQEFPDMLHLRPLVVNEDMVVIGGNMRLKACKELGFKEIPVIISALDEQKQKEFIIKDNISFGIWDWDLLANEWEVEELVEWGLDLPLDFADEEEDSKPIDKMTKNITLKYSIEEADRIEAELYNIAPTLEQAVQILLHK
jgi:hypothetical protein